MSPCCLCPINTHPSYRDAGWQCRAPLDSRTDS
jgi:hypothetical protein